MIIAEYGMEVEGYWYTCCLRSAKGRSQAVLKGMAFSHSYEDGKQRQESDNHEETDEKSLMEFFKDHDEGDKQTMELNEDNEEVSDDDDEELGDAVDGEELGGAYDAEGGGGWRTVAETEGHVRDREMMERKDSMALIREVKLRFELGEVERATKREQEDELARYSRGNTV
jgi:hypothetical protein